MSKYFRPKKFINQYYINITSSQKKQNARREISRRAYVFKQTFKLSYLLGNLLVIGLNIGGLNSIG